MARNDITSKLLKKLYLKKFFSKKEISLFFHCNITTIHKKMEEFDIPTREQAKAVKIAMQKQIIKIPKSKLEKLYFKKKLSIPQIAENLRHDLSIIVRELKRHRIPRRSLSEALVLSWRKKRIKRSVIEKLYHVKKLTQEQIAKKLHKSPEHICKLMKEYGLKARRPSYYHTLYRKYDFSNDLKEKAYLIGFRTGDLGVHLSPSGKLIIVSSTSTKKEQIRLFKNLFQKYGHIWISKPRRDRNKAFMVSLNRTFNFLLPKQDKVPAWARRDKKYFLSFLAGYTDAEGCFYISKDRVAGFRLASYDKKTLKQIHAGLLRIGIICNPPKLSIKKGFIKSDGCIYRNDLWCFTINKKSSLFSLLQLLEPKLKHQKRLRDLKRAKQNIFERNQKHLFRAKKPRLLAVGKLV